MGIVVKLLGRFRRMAWLLALSRLSAVALLLAPLPLHRLAERQRAPAPDPACVGRLPDLVTGTAAGGEFDGCTAEAVASPAGQTSRAAQPDLTRSPCCPSGCRSCLLACCGGGTLALLSDSVAIGSAPTAAAERRVYQVPLPGPRPGIFQPPRA